MSHGFPYGFHCAAMLVLAGAASVTGAQAQTIERVRLTDNDLTCQAIYTEITQMDGLLAKAGATPGSAAAAPIAADAQAHQAAAVNVGAQVAGAVAQQALAEQAVRSGLGNFGGMGGSLGGLFGSIAQSAANAQAQQAAAQQAATAQAAAAQAGQAQQAGARKEHLTGLFLAKGCKMADIQK